jgi:putative hemolysin
MRDALATLFGQKLPAPVEGAIEKLLRLDRLDRLWEDVPGADNRLIADHPLALLNVRPQVSERDLALIPRQGPVVVVANHPFGLIEGAILPSILLSVRPDVKVMANHLLASMPETNRLCIYVDPYGGGQAARSNRKGLKDAIAWLKQGGLLTVFPAGEVSQLNLKERSITDPEWNHHVAGLIRITGATVLPTYLLGGNSAWFHLLGCLHPRVRTALLPHEFFNKHNRNIEVRIGSPITPAKIRAYQDDVALIRYLRRRTYLLENREAAKQFSIAKAEPPAAGVLGELLAGEVTKLAPHRTLVETDDFSVLLAKAREIPNVLHEIGRLREVTFRQVGEGTGKPIDLDRFDDHYWHMFVWNRHANEVVGAYRLGPSDEILARFGPKGFYTSQLFQWKRTYQPGAGTGPLLRAAGIPKDLRAAVAVVERHWPVPDPKSAIQTAVWSGEHQQRVHGGLAPADGEVLERLPTIAGACTAGARAQSVSPTAVARRQIRETGRRADRRHRLGCGRTFRAHRRRGD